MSTATNLTESLGLCIAQYRVARNLKQAELAEQAGVDRTTLSRLEKGKGTLDTLARVLIALEVEARLLDVVPDTRLNPLDPMAAKGQQRQRVRKREDAAADEAWTWGDETP